jgi:U32 family peptidase
LNAPARQPELLAPAGSFEAACAALQYGADAVYLGLPRHSARAAAVNLDADALGRTVRHAHRLTPRRAVYLTLNTLVRDDELPSVLEALEAADATGVDGLIIQDLAVYRLARRFFPDLPPHASTQMAVHSLDGVRALEALGFTRVVLARELSLTEIEAIARATTLEVEVFVHGALCYAYSGLCLFSALQAGRSGNRGQCAYCCRERFTVSGTDQPAYPFSMRDLALLDRVDALRRIGVASLKIEGRMKSPLYVAAVTDVYRRRIDGALPDAQAAEAIADVQTIFSRPWTQLHLDGPRPPEQVIDALAVGHRGTPVGTVAAVRRDRGAPTRWLGLATARALERHDGLQVELPAGGRPFGFGIAQMRLAGHARLEVIVPAGSRVEIALPDDAPPLPAGAPVFCSASQAVQRRYALRLPRERACRATEPLRVAVTLAAGGVTVAGTPVAWPGLAVTLEAAQPLEAARQPEQTAAAVRKAFERLGESPWELAALALDDPGKHYAPPSLLNNLRRQLQKQLDGKLAVRRAAEQAARRAILAAELAPGAAPAPAPTCRVSVKVPVATSPARFEGAGELVLALRVADCAGGLEAMGETWQAAMPDVPIRWALPWIIRDGKEARAVEAAAGRLLARGWRRWECGGLAALHLLRRLCSAPMSLTADGALYGLNRLAGRQLADLGFEGIVAPAEAEPATLAALAAQASPRLIVPVCQRPALFISETRPVVPMANSAGRFGLLDRRGRRFDVASEDGRWVTRAAEPLLRLEPLPALRAAGLAEARVDLTGEAPGAAAAVWIALNVESCHPIPPCHPPPGTLSFPCSCERSPVKLHDGIPNVRQRSHSAHQDQQIARSGRLAFLRG